MLHRCICQYGVVLDVVEVVRLIADLEEERRACGWIEFGNISGCNAVASVAGLPREHHQHPEAYETLSSLRVERVQHTRHGKMGRQAARTGVLVMM